MWRPPSLSWRVYIRMISCEIHTTVYVVECRVSVDQRIRLWTRASGSVLEKPANTLRISEPAEGEMYEAVADGNHLLETEYSYCLCSLAGG